MRAHVVSPVHASDDGYWERRMREICTSGVNEGERG